MVYSVPENVTSAVKWFNYLNEITNENFMLVVIVTLLFVLFISFKSRYETDRSLTSALFLTSIIALPFWSLGLISFKIMLFLMLGTAVMSLYLHFSKRES